MLEGGNDYQNQPSESMYREVHHDNSMPLRGLNSAESKKKKTKVSNKRKSTENKIRKEMS